MGVVLFVLFVVFIMFVFFSLFVFIDVDEVLLCWILWDMVLFLGKSKCFKICDVFLLICFVWLVMKVYKLLFILMFFIIIFFLRGIIIDNIDKLCSI